MLAAFITLVAALPLVLSVSSASATPTDLFFSEYIEGSSNNKALEIFNGTGAPVDLTTDGYSVQMFFNGSTTAGLTINLTGTVASDDVFVVAQSSANAAILAQADQTNGAGWFNGDDAVVLRKGTTVLDVIGQIGLDPGTEWGTGLTSTADNTLRRKSTIQAGDPNGADAFDPATEWNGFATDTVDGLGAHQITLGDQPPEVTTTSPTGGQANVAVDANVSITFSEAVDVTGSWYSISCGSSGTHTATVSGGPTTFTLDPASDFVPSETCTVTVFAGQVSDQDGDDPPDTMTANHVWSFTTVTPPLAIHDIQGAAHVSPHVGETVSTLPAVVTATSSNGFWMQDPSPDANDATSEGIFVFTSSAPTVAVGDAVRVAGRVQEFRPGGASGTNLATTELSSATATLLSTGNPLPAATVVGTGGRIPPSEVIEDDVSGSVETSGVFDPASDGIDFWESMEGMRLQLTNPVAVGPTNDFGETQVVGDDGANASVRTARGGVIVRPNDFNPERIVIDDVVTPDLPVMNVGDHYLGAVSGVLDYNFGNFMLEVTTMPTVVHDGVTPETTTPAGPGQLAVGTFNFENLDPTDPPEKFTRLADILVHNLGSPDIVSGEEVQDNTGPADDGVVSSDETLDLLVAAIEDVGGPTYHYRYINPVDGEDGGEPGGNIRQVFLFRTDRGVSFVDRAGGGSTTPTTVVSGSDGPELSASPGRIEPTDSAFTTSRKPLAGEFMYKGHHLFVIANHFNSKGGDQPLEGRFQPPTRSSEVQRHKQAEIVHDFVASILALDDDANVIVAGDLNDFQFSETVSILKQDVLEDLVDTLPENERYSYVFEGNSQTLDHILLSAALFGEPFDYDIVHVNAEFADQASDHEPSVVRIGLNEGPSVSAGGPYSVDEGGSVLVSATGDDPEGGTLSYAWDLDDNGTFETPGQSATFSAAGVDGPSAHTVAVQVTDEGGLTAESEATVNVANVAPDVSAAFAAPSVDCGASNATLDVSFSDPGPDTFTASVDWGDGSAAEPLGGVTSPFSASHTYAAAGSYHAEVTVTDDDGGPGSAGDDVRVDYDVAVLRPLGDPAKDVFKSTSTIPVRITVADCDGSHPSDLEPRIKVVKTSGSPPHQEINEPVSSSSADRTGVMRFDDGRYVYNLSGRALPDPSGTYRIEITLPNGQVVTASFGLKP
jgi:predicted extracellular nuclease